MRHKSYRVSQYFGIYLKLVCVASLTLQSTRNVTNRVFPILVLNLARLDELDCTCLVGLTTYV